MVFHPWSTVSRLSPASGLLHLLILLLGNLCPVSRLGLSPWSMAPPPEI